MDLYISITPVITQIFYPIAELVFPIGIPTKEAKAEMKTHSLTVKILKSKCLI